MLQISPSRLYLPFRWSVCLLTSTLRKMLMAFLQLKYLMLQHLTWLADYFLKNVRLTNIAHTNTTGYRAYLLLLLGLSSIGVLTNLHHMTFLQIFIISWVIDLYTTLQRLIAMKKMKDHNHSCPVCLVSNKRHKS